MTYFYEHSLNRIDKIFLRSIADQIAKDPEHGLVEPHKVVARLSIANFDQPEVLNYDLLFYLLKECAVNTTSVSQDYEVPTFIAINSPKQNQRFLNAMINQILEQSNYDFLNKVFALNDQRLNYLVNFLNKSHRDCLGRILHKKAEFSELCRDDFVFRTLIVTPICDLVENEEFRENISLFVSSQESFLDAKRFNNELFKFMYGEDIQSESAKAILLMRLGELDVRFLKINHESADSELFEKVYADSRYAINYENIALMLKTQYGLTESDDFKHKRQPPQTPIRTVNFV